MDLFLLPVILWAATGLVLAVGVVPLLYSPIPRGYSKPRQVQLAYATMRLGKLLGTAAEKLRLSKKTYVMRELANRAAKFKLYIAPSKGIQVRNEQFDGIPVRIFKPHEVVERGLPVPALVFYHGGGHCIGSVDVYHGLTSRIAKKLQAVVISVGYRLSPEHIYPAGMEDCLKATVYFMSNAKKYGVDPSRVAIGGDSAGGRLAAQVALHLRDRGFIPAVKLQILLYPTLQSLAFLAPSFRQNMNNGAANPRDLALFTALHVQGHDKNAAKFLSNDHVTPEVKQQMSKTFLNVEKLPPDLIQDGYRSPDMSRGDADLWRQLASTLMDPYFSPLLAKDLSGLPKTYIFTGEHDILRDDGFWYASRLREAGVSVVHKHSHIAFHGIFNFHDMIDECSGFLNEVVEFMKTNL